MEADSHACRGGESNTGGLQDARGRKRKCIYSNGSEIQLLNFGGVRCCSVLGPRVLVASIMEWTRPFFTRLHKEPEWLKW